jgi:polyisoprenoid-binding protein YceI
MLTQARSGAVANRRWITLLLLVGIGSLAGCSARRAERPAEPPPAVEQQAGPVIPRDARRYTIDADRSLVTLRVYRAGPLARLGHNHVITSTAERGYAWTTGEPAASGFEVRVPVAGLVVDDPAARASAGPDFPGEVPADAREGTRRNLLRPEVLDADRYPEIVVRADALAGTWGQPTVTARVTLKDQERSIEIPLAITRDASSLEASGSFRIRQSDFGITPFSVGGGAIQVADQVEVTFEIRATAR